VAEKRPNITILLADDQRFNTIHALGNREICAPVLDRPRKELRRGLMEHGDGGEQDQALLQGDDA
jgi:hypothetical protein